MKQDSSRSVLIWLVVAGCLGLGGLWMFIRVVVARGQPTAAEIAAGRALFNHEWSPGDPLAVEGDGLGPVFNARSCVACHFQGGVGGGGTNQFNVTAFELIPTQRRPQSLTGVVHASAIDTKFQERVGRIGKMFPPVKGGTRIVDGEKVDLDGFDPVILDSINTTALFGAGLIDQIPARAITMDGMKRTLDGFSRSLAGDQTATPVGRVRLVDGKHVGRFGWRGQFASLEQFVATACAVEIGLSNPLRKQDKPRRHQEDHDAQLDLSRQQLRELVSFVASLPRPRQVLPKDQKQRREVLHGEQLFEQIGCAICHTPNIGSVEGIYSDFRLYDVDRQAGGSDYRQLPADVLLASGHPKPNEWKTPPLWGVADSAPYFHDGAALTLKSAILRHAVQAERSRQKFQELYPDDQLALLKFLKSLRAPKIKSESTDSAD